MEFRLLGNLEAWARGSQAELGPRKQRAVLAVLLLRPNEVVPAERIVEQVWGDAAPRTATHAVQNYVSALRKALLEVSADAVIETSPPGYALRIDPDSIDARRFERLVVEGRSAISGGEPERGRATLRTALDLWRGEPLAEFPYADFSQSEARRLTEIRLTGLEAVFAVDIEAGNYQDTIASLQKLIGEHPFREKLRAQLMTALYGVGRQTEALREYREFAAVLAEASGMEPSPALQELEERVLRQDPTLLEQTTPAPPSRRDQGPSIRVGEPQDEFFGSAGVLLMAEPDAPRVGLLFLGTENDRGYNDLGVAGLKRAEGSLDIEPVDIPVAVAGTEWELRQAARAVDTGLLIVMGFPYEPFLEEVIPDFLGVEFVMIDHDSAAPSTRSITFREQEGAFLVGAAAALTSQTGRLGFLGGTRIPVIDRFLAGFTSGARHADPHADIRVDYISETLDGVEAFISPSLGYEKGRALYESGADIVMHAAGSSGLGVFEAARVAQRSSPKLWAIGADSDQYLNLRPDLRPHILTSMMKRCDIAIYDTVRSWLKDELELGSKQNFGLAEGAVGYSRSGGYLDAIADKLDELAAKIIAGEIAVPGVIEAG